VTPLRVRQVQLPKFTFHFSSNCPVSTPTPAPYPRRPSPIPHSSK
jgi:hypothetical protein